MTKRKNLTTDEIEAQAASDLPDREAMSLVNANVAIPVNLALAANVLSDGAVAFAQADQESIMDQSSTYVNEVTGGQG